MPLRLPLQIAVTGDVIATLTRGEAFQCAWAAAGDDAVHLANPKGAIASSAEAKLLDFEEYLTTASGVVGLSIPGEVTATIPIGDHYWTVQAEVVEGNNTTITLSAGPFRVKHSANYL